MSKARVGPILAGVAGMAAMLVCRGAYAQAAACVVDPERELMVRDVSVVDNCERTTWGPCLGRVTGAWTFGHLIAGVAGTNDPAVLSTFVLNWLSHWQRDVTVNGFRIPQRPNISTVLINPWLAASGNTGQLDMRKAPFRLLAIVNRVDLRRQPAYGNGNAGEARFVYNVLNISDPGNPVPTQFNVIFEYGISAGTCDDIRAWGQRWHDLGSIPFGESYNVALQSITDTFTKIGANPAKPNGSALNQLRTNEIALLSPWELREFGLSPASTTGPFAPLPLIQTTVKQTPNHSTVAGQDLLGSQPVADFINQFRAQIIDGTYVVPATFEGGPFLGGATVNQIDFWNGNNSPPIIDNLARHLFSLNTCNACHGRETDTGFKQIEPRQANVRAALSRFLTGETVVDPIDGTVRAFNDLKRRADDLCHLLNTPCSVLSAEAPNNRVH
jgi:hypothetical protein